MKSRRFFILAGIVLLLIQAQAQQAPDQNHDYKIFIDQRDNQSYKIIKIGAQWWFAENLNYDIEGSFTPENDSIGRLYDYESAKKACPEGFHLPSDDEWIELERFLGIPESELFDELGVERTCALL